MVSNKFSTLDELPQGARVGTSSYRRQCQLRHRRPDLTILDLRGNVGTRLGKLDAGDYDAIILASAGLIRLEMEERIRSRLSLEDCLPAVGQGAVGIECRSGDARTHDILTCLNHVPTASRVSAERAVNNRLQGGCQVPLAAYATLDGERLKLSARVGNLDGSILLHSETEGLAKDAVSLGESVAEELLSKGADKILDELREP